MALQIPHFTVGQMNQESVLLVNRLGLIEQCRVVDQSLFASSPKNNELIWNVFVKETHSTLWALMQKCRFTFKEQFEDVLIEQTSGKKWYEISVRPQGKLFSIAYKDITKRNLSVEKHIEEKQFSSIGTLAGGLAHQYNNIHHIVMGFLESSLQLKEQEQTEVIKQAMRKLETGASLTKSLLDYSRGHSERGVGSFYLEEIFDQVRLITEEEVNKYGCTLNLPHTQEVVRGNRIVLEQIIVNLVINAAHACLGKSHKEVSIFSKSVGSVCRIQVKDTGWGISEEDQEKIFTPFFSTKGEFAYGNSPYKEIRGQGLGLALSRRFARQFNGDLVLKRTSPNGTVFELSLPKGNFEEVSGSQNSKSGSSPMKKSKDGKLNFLILDDLPENRLILKFYLKDHANRIFEKESGDLLISDIEKISPDVIFVDWLMPGVGGHQFLSSLKRKQRFDLLKRAYILSGYSDSDEIESWRPIIAGVIEKPVSKAQLLSQIFP